MRLLALSGQRSAALVQYEACRRALQDELDVQPEEETVKLYERIRDGDLAPAAAPSIAAQLPVEKPSPADSHAPPTAGRVQRAETSLQGERRVVTALHIHISGRTVQETSIDAELRAEMMHYVSQILEREIGRYGGEIDRYGQKERAALFGASVAHEDDPERAVLAALDVREAGQGYATELLEREGIVLSLRAGVHTGEVIVARADDDEVQYWEVSAMAGARALAVRTDRAESVSIRVSEETYRLVAPLFEWERAGESAVTDSKVPAYRPLAHRGLPDKGRGIEGLGSPLVGRTVENQTLEDAMARLGNGLGGIVTVVGEVGIGKSRLVAEARQRSVPSSRPPQWVEGRCLSYATGTAYHLWQSMLRDWLDTAHNAAHNAAHKTAPDAPPAAVRDVLKGRVQALCPEDDDDVYPYLAQMMALPLSEEAASKVCGLGAEGLQFVTFHAVETLLERAAAEHPLVVICEDLHWADPTSLALLEHLLPLVDRVPLLCICVLRPERKHGCWRIKEAAAREYSHCYTDLWLRPLGADESATLVSNLLQAEALPPELRESILERAEGNPFYVEEILRSLIDEGSLFRDPTSGRWQVTGDGLDVRLPSTLHGVIAARIDRLPGEARRVLQWASVIGRSFFYPFLSAIVQDAPFLTDAGENRAALDARLLALQRAQLIRERARLPVREYVFKHVLTQEAAYDGLLRRERRAIHRRVAEALEQLYPERIEEQLGLLAYHWEQAGETGPAVEYLRRAGAQAAAQHANDEALGYLNRALALTPEDALDVRTILLLAREGVYDVQGAREAQRQDLAALKELAAALGDGVRRAEIAYRKAQYAYAISDCPASIAAAQQAVTLAQAAGDVARETAAHLQWGITLRRMNDHAAAALRLERALALARRISLRDIEADTLRALGFVRGFQGQYAVAKTYMQQALDLCRQTANVEAEGRVLANLGMWHIAMGDYVTARSQGEQALRIFDKFGFRWGQGEALFCLGFSSFCLGDYAQARSFLEQELETGRETRNPSRESRALADLGLLAHCQGDHKRAQAYSQQGLAVAQGCGNQWYQAFALIVLGHALTGLAQYGKAIDCYQRALTLYREMRLLHYSLDVRAGLARIVLARGEHAKAVTYIQQILDHRRTYPKLEYLWEPLRAYLTCYQVLHAVDDPRAEEVLEAAYRLLQERAGTIKDEGLRRSYLENVPYHREIVALWKK
jgi:predicted ATPase/class 3 adenylate cyclase